MNFFIIFALNLVAVFALPTEETETTNGRKTRIVNGVTATPGQFPFQVGLLYTFSNKTTYWCGGVLISNTRVLTAAHCIKQGFLVRVYLGSTIRKFAEVVHDVQPRDTIIHPGWRPDTLENDISVIRIPYTKFSAKIQPAGLPIDGDDAASYVGQAALTSGWGYTLDTYRVVTPFLQFAKVQIVPSWICKQFYGTNFTHICISTDNGVSTCNGDSGGPLILERSRILVGITSFGDIRGCQGNYPIAFTELVKYLNWIRQNL